MYILAFVYHIILAYKCCLGVKLIPLRDLNVNDIPGRRSDSLELMNLKDSFASWPKYAPSISNLNELLQPFEDKRCLLSIESVQIMDLEQPPIPFLSKRIEPVVFVDKFRVCSRLVWQYTEVTGVNQSSQCKYLEFLAADKVLNCHSMNFVRV